MRSFRAFLLSILLATCMHSEAQYQVRKLPSGLEVRILSVVPIRLQNGEASLMLRYQTPLTVKDSAALLAEVKDIWNTFRTEAENAHVRTAIISAIEVPSGFILKTGNGRNFVFERAADGSWHML